MTALGSPQGAAGGVRDIHSPNTRDDGFRTLLRGFTAASPSFATMSIDNARPIADRSRLATTADTFARALDEAAATDEAIAAERDRLWRTIRVLRRFDAAMLCLVAAVGSAGVEALLAELVAADILVAIGDVADDHPRYRLAYDPGPCLVLREAGRG